MTNVDHNKASMAARENALRQWFHDLLPSLGATPVSIASHDYPALVPVSGDASFRRYFRGIVGVQHWILVDAPPAHENCHRFVAVAQTLLARGVNVPVVHAVDYQQGFMCLSDLGDSLLWDVLCKADIQQAGVYYREAMQSLLSIQALQVSDEADLPPYDAALLDREMELFRDWFCGGLMQISLSAAEHNLLSASFACLRDAALAQPRVFVHRDYHSRNLMVIEGQPPGVLDFQDAVWGPVCYDLVSLLKDCYVAWPADQVESWALEFKSMLDLNTNIPLMDNEKFLTFFHLMGAQRHLKAIGIFARLFLRDGKSRYLADIPRTINYLYQTCAAHSSLGEFAAWLDARILPELQAALWKADPHSFTSPELP
jgi:N-acetylmuramate 1-kinase